MKTTPLRICLIILLIISLPRTSKCQTEPDNLKKYWDYRDRLKKYFLKIGNGVGESIPMENRENVWNALSKVRFGDANIHSGYYIAVLASEYKLLYDAQQFDEAQRTKNELYYAIQAINRLDFSAEIYLGGPNVPGSSNGFIIRDDVRDGFKDNWNNPINSTGYTWAAKDKVDYLSSDWYFRDGGLAGSNYHNDHNEMSQDQIIGLLMGFAFVNKFVDNNAVQPTSADPALQLVSEVQNITHRIFDYVTQMSPTFQTKLSIKLFSYNDPITAFSISIALPATVPAKVDTKENWVIMRPNSSDLVNRGAQMAGFSYIMADVMRDITNNVTTTPAYVLDINQSFSIGPVFIPTFSMLIPLSDIGAEWNDLQNQALPDIALFNANFSHSASFLLDMHWPHLYNIDEVNMQMILAMAAVGDTWDPANLNAIVQNSGWRLFGLMNSALHNHTTGITSTLVKYELDIAPCEGPNDIGPASWNSTNRYLHPNQPGIYPGEYNGLDYMLLYNLYQLNYKTTIALPDYKNTACPCSSPLNGPYLSSMPFHADGFGDPINPITHQLNYPVTLERKFADYLNFGNSAPEYLSENLILNDPLKPLHINTELIVCNNSTLEVKNTAILTIGEVGKVGVLRIKPGSTLILKTGSQIILNDQSKVIVEPGANFIYEPGALIYMQGEQTLFDVQTTNVNITINSGEQFFCTRSWLSLIGGTIKFAGGTFNLNTGGSLINDGCKIIMAPAMNFNCQANSLIQLSQTVAEIHVLNPNTTITIPSNTEFYTTKDGSAEGGLIYFAGGNFDLQSNGKINNNGCKIHLGNSMNLDYYNGSNIDLTGTFAMLYVDGTLHLHPNADFHFNNNGYIKFGLPPFVYPNINSDASCTITFTGLGTTDKVLEIADQTDVFLTNSMGLFKIELAKVELGYQSSINVANAVNFNYSHFTSTNAGLTGFGIVTNGQSLLNLDHLDVDYLKYGIRARNFYGNGADFKLTNSSISYCDYGLITWDKGASLTNVNIHDCTFWGWQALGMSRPSRAILSKFNTATTYGGVYYEGAGSSLLKINYCEINNNAAVGLAVVGPTLATVSCSEIKDNMDGNISYPQVPALSNAAIKFNAALNLSPVSLVHSLGGYTNFSTMTNQWYNTGSLLSSWGWSGPYTTSIGGSAFYLQNGFNNFSKDPNFRFASGQLNDKRREIIAAHNQWYPSSLTEPDPIDVLLINNHLKKVIITDKTPDYFNGCPLIPVDPGNQNGKPYPLYNCPACPTVNTPRFNNTPLNEALLQAIDMTKLADTSNGNDLIAFQMLYDINRVCLLHDAADVSFLQGLSYSFIKATFGSAVKDSLINSTTDANFNLLVTLQTYLLNNAIVNDDDNGEYYYTLDLAFSYLAVNDRDQALQILNNLSPCIELAEEQYEFLNHWKNLIQVENLILTEQNSIFEFDSLVDAGYQSGNRFIFTDSKANIDTINFDSVAFTLPSPQSVIDIYGNSFTVGSQTDSSYNYLLTKSDSLAQVIWSYPFDGRLHDSDIVKTLCLDGLGNIYVTGKSWNHDNYEVTTVKFDSAGNQYWTAVYNSTDYLNDEPTGMEINQDGKLVIVGKSYNDTLERFFKIAYSQCDSFCVPTYRESGVSMEKAMTFSFSPNPVVDGYLKIAYQLMQNEPGMFEIYDMQGRQLYHTLLQPKSTAKTISLPVLATGIYHLMLHSGGKKISKKLAVLTEGKF